MPRYLRQQREHRGDLLLSLRGLSPRGHLVSDRDQLREEPGATRRGGGEDAAEDGSDVAGDRPQLSEHVEGGAHELFERSRFAGGAEHVGDALRREPGTAGEFGEQRAADGAEVGEDLDQRPGDGGEVAGCGGRRVHDRRDVGDRPGLAEEGGDIQGGPVEPTGGSDHAGLQDRQVRPSELAHLVGNSGEHRLLDGVAERVPLRAQTPHRGRRRCGGGCEFGERFGGGFRVGLGDRGPETRHGGGEGAERDAARDGDAGHQGQRADRS
ncbi:hypothetical protein [Saccharopolyspora sp. 6V]|uniref:hypothetical protein n=1 Tax=Saccharopolyspora sp. 6V TaxID=2877239 RepID=UPI001CD6FAC4|nr:hypothetical protein [Saccharopolyspora sp. 6V]MCA1195136.1 hypothetical protein [Saccharopolyspora sp. 6V]